MHVWGDADAPGDTDNHLLPRVRVAMREWIQRTVNYAKNVTAFWARTTKATKQTNDAQIPTPHTLPFNGSGLQISRPHQKQP